jgi:uncharacterized protein (UPF0297 family)
MKYIIHYTVANNKESVIFEGTEADVDDVMHLMRSVYKCKCMWYTTVDSGKGRDAKQTLNYVYGSLVQHGLAGVIG